MVSAFVPAAVILTQCQVVLVQIYEGREWLACLMRLSGASGARGMGGGGGGEDLYSLNMDVACGARVPVREQAVQNG